MSRRRRNDRDVTGVLVLDKPVGISSHDLVRRVRRAYGTSRVGHAGTLDPLASGVMVLLLGAATRIAEWVQEDDKEYLVTLLLGRETDTQDITGVTLFQAGPVEAEGVTPGGLRWVLDRFTGSFDQTPPVFSAIKVGGQPLYRLARKGEAAPPPPRRVTVRRIDLVRFEPPRAVLSVACGKGTYMRTLCHDLGRALGTGGCMEALVRTKSGGFALEQAASLEALLAAPDPDALLLDPLSALPFPRVEVGEEALSELRKGRPAPLPPGGVAAPEGGLVSVAHGGRLVAVGELSGGALAPRKVLAPREGEASKSLCKSGEKC